MSHKLDDRPTSGSVEVPIDGTISVETFETLTFAEIVDGVLAEAAGMGCSSELLRAQSIRTEILRRAAARLRGAGAPKKAAASRSISQVDFGTVLTALTVSGRLAAEDARQHGLKPAGRG